MKNLKILLVVFSSFLILNFYQLTVFGEEYQKPDIQKTISGTISLPNGNTAVTGGIKLGLSLYGTKRYISTEITILEGQNSASYSFTLYSDDETNNLIVCYYLVANIENLSGQGYYCTQGTTNNVDDATKLSVPSDGLGNINITLLDNAVISGTLQLPEGKMAPKGGIKLKVRANQSNGGIGGECSLSIPEGSTGTSFTLKVPYIRFIGYYIAYDIETEEHRDYCTHGYYSDSGTVDAFSAKLLYLNSGETTGIKLTLRTGTRISGKAYLPQGEKAPKGGIKIHIYTSTRTEELIEKGIAYVSDNCFTVDEDGNKTANYGIPNYLALDDLASAFIPEGQNEADYYFTVSSYSIKLSQTLLYKATIKGKYVWIGYYIKNGYTEDHTSAAFLKVGNKDITGINLLLPTERPSISGRIVLPGNKTAPPGGLRVGVAAITGKVGYATTYVRISEGQNVCDFTLTPYSSTFPDDCIIHYSLDAGHGFISGFYCESGTVFGAISASKVSITQKPITNIEIKLLSGDFYGMSPASMNGIVMLPLETVCRSIGAEYSFDKLSQSVEICRDGMVIQLDLSNKIVNKNGTITNAQFEVSDNIVYIPISFFYDAFGYRATWNKGTEILSLIFD